jgi:alpha-1,6-rhamnosyltransferase
MESGAFQPFSKIYGFLFRLYFLSFFRLLFLNQAITKMSMTENCYPLVSVIIPAFDSCETIRCAIESIQKQSYQRIVCIVIDDGSEDDTCAQAVEACQNLDGFDVYSKENGGASSARNFGVSKIPAETEYLFFLDADDYLKEDAIEKLVGYMEEHPEVGLLGCQFHYVDYDSDRIIPWRRTRIAKRGLFVRDLRDDELETPFHVFFCGTGQGPYALYRRSVFERTAGWSEDFWGHNDTDMFIQMALEAPVHYLPEVLYFKKKVRTSLEHRANREELYSKLRSKWDNYQPKDPRKNLLLNDAKRYYYRWHSPLRDLKVARVALADFSKNPSMKKWRWFFHLARSGTKGLLFGKSPNQGEH